MQTQTKTARPLQQRPAKAWDEKTVDLAAGGLLKTDRGQQTRQKLIEQLSALIAQHGEQNALNTGWLRKNNYSGIVGLIWECGGIAAAVELLKTKKELPENFDRYKEKFVQELAMLVKARGPAMALNTNWLRENGHSGLVRQLEKYGGIRGAEKLLVEQNVVRKNWRKTARKKAFLDELGKLAEKHGWDNALNTNWLRKNGYSRMVEKIREHGGVSEVEKMVGK